MSRECKDTGVGPTEAAKTKVELHCVFELNVELQHPLHGPTYAKLAPFSPSHESEWCSLSWLGEKGWG